MATPRTALPMRRTFGQTMRKDAWWIQPLVVFTVFTGFIIYSTWAAFQGTFYFHENLLSPFYSPEIWGVSEHALMQRDGTPAWWPGFLPYSPAFLILWAPVSGFRFTCYYYRGAYYKAFWADPPSCAVGEPRKEKYLGERSFPLILQNVHRYFAVPSRFVFIVILSIRRLERRCGSSDPATGQARTFGDRASARMVLTVNVIILLGGYTLGLPLAAPPGGRAASTSSPGIAFGKKAYERRVHCLNARHMALRVD